MNKEQKSFVKYLIKASIIDIVRPSEIQKFINEGLFQCDNSIKEVVQESEAPPTSLMKYNVVGPCWNR